MAILFTNFTILAFAMTNFGISLVGSTSMGIKIGSFEIRFSLK
jgi:hypothetical protein